MEKTNSSIMLTIKHIIIDTKPAIASLTPFTFLVVLIRFFALQYLKKLDITILARLIKNIKTKKTTLPEEKFFQCSKQTPNAKMKLQNMFNQIDLNGDGLISFEEFSHMIKGAISY